MSTSALLAGCAGDSEESATTTSVAAAASSAGVEVVARDIKFGDNSHSAAGGTVEVSYRNEGNIPHTLLIDDVADFKLEVTASGDEDHGTVVLEPGTYTLYCDVPGHRDAGMEATLEIA